MIVRELKGNLQVFTLSNGKTLRLFPRKSAEVSDSLITSEFKIAEKMGLIVISKSQVKTEEPKMAGGK